LSTKEDLRMARIIDIVRTRRDAIAGDSADADRTGQLALAALLAGIGDPSAGTITQAWQDYMNHFPGLNTDQLRRLLALDGTDKNTNLNRKRAYLVANAICGSNSPNTGMLADKVNTIDDGLPDACDAPPADLFI
jgi:hypothetical protein